MRVTFNVPFRNGVYDIMRASEALVEAQRQVSSGKRVERPSDDPSASAGVVSAKAEMRAIDSYVRATDSADARLKVVDTVLSDAITSLQAAQVKTAAASNSFLTPQQREALALEIEGIRDALLSAANAEFRGMYVFSGTASTTEPFPRVAGVVQPYAGNAASQQVDIDESKAVDVTFDGAAVFGDLFDDLDQLIAAVRAGNTDGPGFNLHQGMRELNQAFDRLTTAQSRVGNHLSTLSSQHLRLDEMRRAGDSMRSKLEDANMAEAITKMQQADAAHRAALGAVGATTRLSLMDYLR